MTIKELREEKKLSQSALAKAIGVTPGAISQIESGRVKLSGRISAKIREIYGVELASSEQDAVKPAPAEKKKASRKPAAKESPAKQYANEIIIQSPMGGEITLEQVIEKLPEAAESVYIRVDQNKLWWVGGEDSWYVEIWE